MNNDNNVLTYKNDLSDRTGQQKRTLDKYFLLIEISKVLGVFLILVIPFAVDKSLPNPTQDGQMFYLLLIGVVLVGLLGFQLVFLSNKIRIRITVIDLLSFIAFVYITVHTKLFFSEHTPFSYWSILSLYIVYLFFRINLNETSIHYVLIGIVVIGFAQTIYGCLQLYGFSNSYHSLFRVTGSFFNPGPFAGYLASVFPVFLGVYIFRKKLLGNIKNEFSQQLLLGIVLIGLFVTLFVVLVVKSRASWLSILFSSSYLYMVENTFWVTIKKKLKNIKVLLSTVLIVGGSIGVCLLGLYKFKQGSADGRMLIWSVTLDMIKDAPLFGHGLGQFKAQYMNYQAEYFINNTESIFVDYADNTIYAFNELLHIWTEFGLFGVGFLLLLFYLLLFRDESNQTPILYIAKSGVFGILVFSCFSYPLDIDPIMITAVLYLVLLSYHHCCYKINHLKIFQKLRLSSSGFILILLALFFFRKQQENHKAYERWKIADLTYKMKSYKSSVRVYEEVYTNLKYEGTFLLQYGKALQLSGEYGKCIEVMEQSKEYLNNTILYIGLGDCYEKKRAYEKAESMYSKARDMLPIRFYPLYLLAKLYHQTGQKTKLKEVAHLILKKKVKIKSIAIKQMREEVMNMLEVF